MAAASDGVASRCETPSAALLGNPGRLRLLTGRLGLAGAAQDARQGVVALVAGVFVKRALCGGERPLAAPGRGVDRRVLDLELIADLLRRDAREALVHLGVLRQVDRGRDARAQALARIEVGGLDDQRVAFPMPDRIAHPGPDG